MAASVSRMRSASIAPSLLCLVKVAESKTRPLDAGISSSGGTNLRLFLGVREVRGTAWDEVRSVGQDQFGDGSSYPLQDLVRCEFATRINNRG